MTKLMNIIANNNLDLNECAAVVDAVNAIDPTVSLFDFINWNTGGVKGLEYDFNGVKKMSRAVETIVGPEVYLFSGFPEIKEALYKKIGLVA